MTVFEIPTTTTFVSAANGRAQSFDETSPFAAAALSADAAALPGPEFGVRTSGSLTTPFLEAFARMDEYDLEAQALAALRAEFADEDFETAVQALTDEAAARHLVAASTWGEQTEALSLADSEVERWMDTVAAKADRLLAELETHFGERPLDTLAEGEIEAVTGFGEAQFAHLGNPVDAQELFLGKLVSKVKKVVGGVAKIVKKGVAAVGKLLPIGKLLGVLRKLVKPLLQRVLQKAIGKLPATLQPIARKLAAKFGGAAQPGKGQSGGAGPASPAPAGPAPDALPADAAPAADAGAAAADPAAGETGWSAEALAEDFDATVAQALLAPHDAATEAVVSGYEAEAGPPSSLVDGPYAALDAGRRRLARRLVEAEPGRPPIAEVEEFIPVVAAAMKLVKLGVKIIGRKRVINLVAQLLATLIQGMVGQQAATQLSRHVADAGLRLLGLEAERAADGTLGAEALVATAEDTIREVLRLPGSSLENELLMEAAVQEAFTAAAVRHVPPALLRADLRDAQDERGIWLMFPRGSGAHYRYKKYSLVEPLQITRPMARAVVFAEGESLEDRLLDAGARAWPVAAEAHFYELLPGAELGQLAAFEAFEDEGSAGALGELAAEFEELARPLPFAHPKGRGGDAQRGGPQSPRRALHPGARYFRLRTPGLRPRRRPPFSVRMDVTGGKPAITVHLHVGERVAHELVGHLEKRELVRVVAVIRRLVTGPARDALAQRLRRALDKNSVTLAEDAAGRLAGELTEAIARVVADHLPASAAALATAAKDAAPGVTLSFAFSFADTAALTQGKAGDPTLKIRSGVHRD